MNADTILEQIGRLPVDQQLILVQQIWDGIARHRDLPLSEAKCAELDRRIEAYQSDPSDVVSWEQIKEDRRKA